MINYDYSKKEYGIQVTFLHGHVFAKVSRISVMSESCVVHKT